MTASLLRRAADILDEDAETLRTCHTVDEKWDQEVPEIHDRYREMIALATALREMSGSDTARPIVTDLDLH